MTDIYIHVGLPKTGTTFLQEHCFPHLTGVHFIHRGFWTPLTGVSEWLWRTVEAYPLFTDMGEQRAEADRLLEEITEGKLLISSERLFGDIFLGFRDHFQVTKCLHHLFPSAKIILTIRRQDEFLESFYRQLLKAYFYSTIDGFLGYVNDRFEDWVRPHHAFPGVNVWRLNYDIYAQNYANIFGRRNVMILPYEMLRQNPQQYHKQLAAFMGVAPYIPPENIVLNPSYSLLSCRIALLLNRFVRSPWGEKRLYHVIPHEPFTPYLRRRSSRDDVTYRALNALNRRLSLRYVLENVVDRIYSQRGSIIGDEKRRKILEIHRESNRRLEKEHGLDLQQYGYC